MDRYANFGELARHEREGIDYRIETRLTESPIAVLAPHGGYIERGTLQIARAIAGASHRYYGFVGLHPGNPRRLHLTSNNFDEPRALQVVSGARQVLTVHGARGSWAAAYLGGRDSALRARLIEALRAAGFPAEPDPSPTRQGLGATNICNRGASGRGVQLELTLGLRRRLFSPRSARGEHLPNCLFHAFCAVVREALERSSVEPADHDTTLMEGLFACS